MTNTVWWHIIGSLFVVGFISSLVVLFWSSGDKAALVTIVGMMSGALLIWFVSPRLTEFEFGPTRVTDKVTQIQKQLDDQGAKVRQQGQLLERQQEEVPPRPLMGR